MPRTPNTLSRQLEELSLLQHSLLPGEALVPASPRDTEDGWQALLASWQEHGGATDLAERAHSNLPPAHFRVQADGVDVWFELQLADEYGAPAPHRGAPGYAVAVKGGTLGRREQEAWQAFVEEKMEEVRDSECVPGSSVSSELPS